MPRYPVIGGFENAVAVIISIAEAPDVGAEFSRAIVPRILMPSARILCKARHARELVQPRCANPRRACICRTPHAACDPARKDNILVLYIHPERARAPAHVERSARLPIVALCCRAVKRFEKG